MVRQNQLERIKKLGYELTFMTDFVYLLSAAYRDLIFGPKRAALMVPCAASEERFCDINPHRHGKNRCDITSQNLTRNDFCCDTML